MPITLPTQVSEVDNRFSSQKVGIIGPPGIGKSEFLSGCSNNLFIQTEAGLNHLRVMKVPCRSFGDLREILTALIQAKQAGKLLYEAVTLDTIDEFLDIINEEVIRRGREKFQKIANDINTIGDIPNGAGWQWSTELIKLTLDKLESLEIALFWIGHMDMKEVKTATDKYHKSTLSIGGKTGLSLLSWPDHLLNIEASYNGSKLIRKVRTRPTQYLDAKSRGGVVPDGWLWSDDMKENWTKFRGLFT